MTQINLGDDYPGYANLRDIIHQLFGKPANLFRGDYNVVIDDDLKDDVRIGGGSCIQIMVRYSFRDERFMRILKHVFEDYHLKRDFLRSKAMIRYSDATRWYGAAESGYFKKVDKKASVSNFTVRHVTMLEVMDKKTKKRVEVKIEGNAFDAMDKAVKLLYPESHIEEEKEAVSRARNTKKGGSE